MYEASKATMRRNFDRRFATTYFVGDGIDIGCGHDCIGRYSEFYPLLTSIRPYDQEHGDGTYLADIADESFDFVHSSHSLEHMSDMSTAMTNWVRVLKPGGHMILLLPDEDMFEQGTWPSVYTNGDHQCSFTIYKNESWCKDSINILEFLMNYPMLEILKLEKLDSTYLYSAPKMDQTRLPIGECAIEIILRKRTQEEFDAKGRLPKSELLTFGPTE